MTIDQEDVKIKTLSIKPYARLIQMLGDQLIRDEKTALIEIIKNSYDADANWVQVRFKNFEIQKTLFTEQPFEEIFTQNNSYIEIEDDGIGMDFSTIEDSWMNPATPNKLNIKSKEKNHKTKKNRYIQGDKGIGRYSVFKLGNRVEVFTKNENDSEIYVDMNLTPYKDGYIKESKQKNENGKDEIKKEDMLLTDLKFEYKYPNDPQTIKPCNIMIRNKKLTRGKTGTRIRISDLNHDWNKKKIEEILKNVLVLENPFKIEKENVDNRFCVEFLINQEALFKEKEINEKFEELFDMAPLKVEKGKYDSEKNLITFTLNNKDISFPLEKLKEIKEYKEYFLQFFSHVNNPEFRKPECGSFDFTFYIFDFSPKAPSKYKLEKSLKEKIKSKRIYLYRDGIRVFPYGNPDDDWLQIDVLRGLSRAGDYLSNDQTTGWVQISSINNPDLMDKTNREGLLEIKNAFKDFRALLQSILGYLMKEFKKYKDKYLHIEEQIIFKEKQLKNDFEQLANFFKNKGDNNSEDKILNLKKKYDKEREFLINRYEQSEDLAGVGLAVECTSHDMMMMIDRAKDTISDIIQLCSENENEGIKSKAEQLNGQISFIWDQIKGIQPLFTSSKINLKKENVRITEVLKKTKKYFNSLLQKYLISINIVEKHSRPLIFKTYEGSFLQTFINLFDNAFYWLKEEKSDDRKIEIIIDSLKGEIIFADNGPGIETDDQDYIFNAFFSTRGLSGRGLGLYIAKQLLEKNDFIIDLIKNDEQKILPGANFIITQNLSEEVRN